ncbi:UDP-N-acetylmuramoyl-tripeptide--D-alanyl-D-alanine ligase [Simiduia curdlanivorans]|uniref:UDP-N-acetylmuramoyl-tripeptide--D-alanyl-D-alanine ligase n=1 Tax=Simiduia curdlanivorans TaxID=1492769 RepID=A0ABV8V8U6_9GAMM|nr:UDP-N-acetylmuramoyl-tripeptide--D-alanyl-D-alanine ligase [Simiduia curdlanivorans]MDN3638967.1 UDP-N-acetylmuramoyl-tripeptide--D-alanyl-D-alanine ligase [Simiduia curdlanivorans]
MIRPLSLGELERKFGGVILGNANAQFNSVSTDSRTVGAGELFVALIGDKFDGHDYVSVVQQSNPAACVVSKAWADINKSELGSGNYWCVDDTTLALGHIAVLAREAFAGPLIAITGSCGKTTVKEMLLSIASAAFGESAVLATQGNFNNHIGVPKTLFRLLPQHQFAIIEMGASGPDEIAYLTRLASPSVAVVNNVMPAHVEGFGSVEGVAQTKSAIYQGLGQDGVAIINLDDSFAGMFVAQNQSRRRVSVAINQLGADLRADNITLLPEQSVFDLYVDGKPFHVALPVAGLHNVRNALVAAACAFAAGISVEHLLQGLSTFSAVKGRMNISKPSSAVTLIDDTYNANPGSVKAAIDALVPFEGARWLVLGDMGELGRDEILHHQEVGEYAKAAQLSGLVSVGKLSQYAAERFDSNNAFDSQQEVVTFLKDLIDSQAGHITILIKGSRSARMELIVQAITALVRTN